MLIKTGKRLEHNEDFLFITISVNFGTTHGATDVGVVL